MVNLGAKARGLSLLAAHQCGYGSGTIQEGARHKGHLGDSLLNGLAHE